MTDYGCLSAPWPCRGWLPWTPGSGLKSRAGPTGTANQSPGLLSPVGLVLGGSCGLWGEEKPVAGVRTRALLSIASAIPSARLRRLPAVEFSWAAPNQYYEPATDETDQ